MPLSDEYITALEKRISELESTVQRMKALAKGDPGRDGKDGRDGRDGKALSLPRVLASIRNANPAPRIHLSPQVDALVNVQPASVSFTAPDVHVSSPAVNVNAILPETPQPDIHVHVAAPTVTVPAEAFVVKAELPEAPRPWPTETKIVERDVDGRAKVMETRPLDK